MTGASQFARRWCLFTYCLAMFPAAVSAAELMVRLTGDNLRFSARKLGFLEGRTLQRLHDGVAMRFDFQLQIVDHANRAVLRRIVERFAVSYDLWEEKFSVSRLSGARRSVSHLAPPAVEAWCLDQMATPVHQLPADREMRIRLEVRGEDPNRQRDANSESGISLADLIEAFSRTTRPSQQKWSFESAPFRLSGLKSERGALLQ